MAKTDNLTDFLTDIADTLRAKKGTTNLINPQNFSSEIASIETGSGTDMLQARVDETKDCSFLFYSYRGKNIDFAKNLTTVGVSRMQGTFQNCESLNSLDLSKWDTSNVTTMQNMFTSCKELTDLDLSTFDTGNVTDFNATWLMFGNCRKLKSLIVNNWNTSGMISMSNMFSDCRVLPELDISSWDTSNVMTTGSMFENCYNLSKILGTLDMIKVTSDASMFYNCYALIDVTLKNIKISVTMGSGTSYGTKLSNATLINTIKELWDLTGSTSQTLTLSTASKTALESIYVKLVDPTEEQIAQDPNIIYKKNCEVCESTDEGAMLITNYATLKNWTIA